MGGCGIGRGRRRKRGLRHPQRPHNQGEEVILRTFTYQVALGGKDPQPVMDSMRQLAAALVRINPKLRGLKLEHEGDHLMVMMRVAGMTRFYIQADARNLIMKFIRRAQLPVNTVKLMLATTEVNGRQLYLGEGRTEMTRRPRAERKADGTPWDDYAWFGDELPDIGLFGSEHGAEGTQVGVAEDGDNNRGTQGAAGRPGDNLHP
jgi:hypothetical protein